MKSITIADFLTQEQISRAFELRRAKLIHDEIIAPNIAQITYKLGEQCDPRWLAFVTEYSVIEARKYREKLH